MKILPTTNGKTAVRVSRWIQVKRAYNIKSNHPLYYYALDAYGNRTTDKDFDPNSENTLEYFCFHGKTYALDQFMPLDTPITYKESGKVHYLYVYDAEDYDNPLIIEASDGISHVRCYHETPAKYPELFYWQLRNAYATR